MTFADGEVVIYVEDPPAPPTCEPEIVEVEKIVYVEVPAVCEDNNNGHGNDVGHVDNSNPGKKYRVRNAAANNGK
jgi:hypothetical protein